MSSSGTRPDDAPVGATRVAAAPRRKRGLWLLLALLALVAVMLLLSRCGGSDATAGAAGASPTASPAVNDPTASAGTSGASAPSDASTATATAATGEQGTAGTDGAAGAVGAAGTVVVGGSDVVLGPDGVKDLTAAAADTKAVGRQVPVQSVPADEGFWVGTSVKDRLWVQLDGQAGESAYQVKVGDRVDFTGTTSDTSAGFAKQVGVSADEGAAQLTSQGRHLVVNKSDVRLAK